MRLEWFISSSCNIQDFGAYKLTFLFYTARVKSKPQPCKVPVPQSGEDFTFLP